MTTLCEPFTPLLEKRRREIAATRKLVKPSLAIKIVTDYFELDEKDVMGRRRFQRLSFCRFVIYKILYRNTLLTQEQLGEVFGVDRTSVIYGITALTGWMDIYPEVKSEFENIEKIVLNENID